MRTASGTGIPVSGQIDQHGAITQAEKVDQLGCPGVFDTKATDVIADGVDSARFACVGAARRQPPPLRRRPLGLAMEISNWALRKRDMGRSRGRDARAHDNCRRIAQRTGIAIE